MRANVRGNVRGTLNRRRFLTGLGGVTVALPFLESLGFRPHARAQAMPTPKRFVCFFQCNGANMSKFWPQGGYGALTEAHFPVDRTLYALRPYRDKLLIPRNMHMSPRGFGQDGSMGCDHQSGMGHKLTAQLLGSGGFAQGISVDQFIASKINPSNRPSLTLGVHGTNGQPTGCISYSGPGTPVNSEPNPRLGFEDMMGINYGDAVVRDLLGERRKSVLDLVHQEFDALARANLSKGDRDKLDLHFTSVRELEQQLAGTGGAATMACQRLDPAREAEIRAADKDRDVRQDAAFKPMGRMQMDLVALALACDYTRTATLQWGAGAGGPIFNWDNIAHQYNHHKLSHGSTSDSEGGSDVAGYETMIYDIDRWFAGEFAYLLDRLNAYSEGTGTVLDNSCVMWINELSDGKDHDFRDLPCVLAGSCGGVFKQGQYLNLSQSADARQTSFEALDAPHNKLLTTIVNAVGAGPLARFGHPTLGGDGEFTQLKA